MFKRKQKNILAFSVPIKKELDNGKSIACKPPYQNLLITYLKLIAKNVEIKTANLSVSLKGLKITTFLIVPKSAGKKNS